MKGWKTYAAAAALAAWAVLGQLAGQHDSTTMVTILLAAASIAGLRNAITP